CHRYQGHDAMGIVKFKADKETLEPATAADLGHFGSREWLQSVLVDYHHVFEPIVKSVQDPTDKMTPEQKTALEKFNDQKKHFLAGDMAGWVENNKAKLQDAANAES